MVPFCPLSSLSSSTVSLANSVSNDANGVVPGGGKYKTASRSNSRGLYDASGGNNGYSTFPRYACIIDRGRLLGLRGQSDKPSPLVPSIVAWACLA